MDDTHFYLPRDQAARLATVYSASDTGLERAPDPGGMVGQGAYVEGPRKSFSGGAGLLSTAEASFSRVDVRPPVVRSTHACAVGV